jgi:hypothetical protein
MVFLLSLMGGVFSCSSLPPEKSFSESHIEPLSEMQEVPQSLRPQSLSETMSWFLENYRFEDQLNYSYEQLYQVMRSGDIDKVHQQLFENPENPARRLFRFYGVPQDKEYTFYLGKQTPRSLGETQFQVYLEKLNAQTFLLESTFEVFLKQGPLAFPQVLDRFAANLLQPAQGLVYQRTYQNTQSLDRLDYETLWRLKHSYPYLYPLLQRYVFFHSLLGPLRDIPQIVDLQASPNWKNLEKDYPVLIPWFKRFQRFIDSHITLKNKEEETLVYFNINSQKSQSRALFALDQEGLVPVKHFESIGPQYGFQLQKLQDFEFFSDFVIEAHIFGLHLTVDQLRAKLKLQLSPTYGKVSYELLPQVRVRAEGSLFGWVPKSLINVLIPSNLEEILRNFVEEMIRDGGTQGYLEVQAVPDGFLWKTHSRQKFLNNGFLQFAAHFVRVKFHLTPEQRQEFGTLLLRILYALEELPLPPLLSSPTEQESSSTE